MCFWLSKCVHSKKKIKKKKWKEKIFDQLAKKISLELQDSLGNL